NTLKQARVQHSVCVIAPGFDVKAYTFDSSISRCINPKPVHGPISSIYHGIRGIDRASGYLIWPVDHPVVEHSTITYLITEFLNNPDSVIKPQFRGRSGHPIIIPAELAWEIPYGEYEGGLRKLMRDGEWHNIFIDIDDEGIIANINTKDDLKLLNRSCKKIDN
ncbi:NTP transferase domain-containing protein, partial [bacterium]|nr:NTP transferase domain-containing protein [bacterium]